MADIFPQTDQLPNVSRSSLNRFPNCTSNTLRATLFLALLVIGGCATQTPLQPVIQQTQPAVDTTALLRDAAKQARALLAAAALAPPIQRRRMELEAAEHWLQAGRISEALNLARKLDFSIDSDEWLLRRQLLIARTNLQLGNQLEALKALGFLDQLQVSQQSYSDALQLINQITDRSGLHLSYLDDLQAQLSTATSAQQRHQLQSDILNSLLNQPLAALDNNSGDGFSTQLLPWVELAQIARTTQEALPREHQLYQWRNRYPQLRIDPALLTELQHPDLLRGRLPTKIALLLPYSGSLKSVGEALHRGIMSRYFSDPLSAGQIEISSHDVGDDANIAALYIRAVAQGAELVIGPLRKQHITTLIERDLISVPTIALNQVNDPETFHPLLVQLSLSPEAEIKQLAGLAWAQGHRRAAAFYPQTDWGRRQQRAFARSWQALGGDLVAQTSYSPKGSDFSKPIKKLLGLDLSEARYKKLQRGLGQSLLFNPRRRQDIDFLFLAAFPPQARSIRPQFRFHQADQLPVFASSHVYGGSADPALDKDLNQVRFCDTPFTLNPRFGSGSNSGSGANPDSSIAPSLPSIHALGRDAFALVPYIEPLQNSRLRRFEGDTGRLRIDAGGLVQSHLSCGRFRRGVAIEVAAWR
ncbi:MAG: penicillin-binding protein activator [Immundisolibacteraceae bacterium]|nr:penicillin-binding protein activator [Immundisolibacteraceae bacterium]